MTDDQTQQLETHSSESEDSTADAIAICLIIGICVVAAIFWVSGQ